MKTLKELAIEASINADKEDNERRLVHRRAKDLEFLESLKKIFPEIEYNEETLFFSLAGLKFRRAGNLNGDFDQKHPDCLQLESHYHLSLYVRQVTDLVSLGRLLRNIESFEKAVKEAKKPTSWWQKCGDRLWN